MQVDRPSPKYPWREFLRPQERRSVAELDKQRDEARAALQTISEAMNLIRQRATIRAKYRAQNASKERCAELRRIAQREVDAAEKSARTAIEKRSLEMQEKIMVTGLASGEAQTFLAMMPTVETLMPVLSVDRVEGMIEHRRSSYDD